MNSDTFIYIYSSKWWNHFCLFQFLLNDSEQIDKIKNNNYYKSHYTAFLSL